MTDIVAAGKSIQVYGKAEEVHDLIKTVGARGVLITVSATADHSDD
ncbi:MAG: hypothetical protein P1S60_08760 [Anaerolineae bacterium]|nr:hypothetical protein [Anaerolineae bacterium]